MTGLSKCSVGSGLGKPQGQRNASSPSDGESCLRHYAIPWDLGMANAQVRVVIINAAGCLIA